MAVPKAIAALQSKTRTQLNTKLLGGEDITGIIAEYGLEISVAALERYRKDVQEQFAQLLENREAAIAYAELVPDDDGAQARLLNDLIQDLLLQVTNEVSEYMGAPSAENYEIVDEKVRLVGQLTRAIADLNRSSIAADKFAHELRAKQLARLQEKLATQPGGIDKEFLQMLMTDVLGI